MNILVSSASEYFTDHVPASEGLISHEIVSRLAGRGHNLWVISPKIKLRRPMPRNVRLFETGSHDIFSNDSLKIEAGRLKFAIQAFRISGKIVGENKIDLVHHILPSDFGRFFDLVPLLLKRPFVVGPAFLPWELPKGELGVSDAPNAKLARLAGRPYGLAKRMLFRETVKRCDALLVSTRRLGEMYSGLIDGKKIHNVPIGVDTSVFRPGVRKAKRPIILAAGLLHKRKGFDYLIRAMPKIIEEVPEAELVIAGDGIHRKYFESMTCELGLQKTVRFLGYLPRHRMVKLYQECSLFCLPSLSEPFGMVLLEAMSCGKPGVATDVGGIPEIMKNGKNGLLVPPKNVELLAGKIAGLLSDGRKLSRFGREARKTALRYDWDGVVDMVEKVYSQVTLFS